MIPWLRRCAGPAIVALALITTLAAAAGPSGQRATVGFALATTVVALLAVAAQSSARGRHAIEDQARRAAIVDGSSDAVIGENLDGIITDWNPGAERMFGYPASVAVGRAAAELILPPERADEDLELRTHVARGARVLPRDTTRRRADGLLIDASVTASPIANRDGRIVGLSKTIRDISDARRAERRVHELNASLEAQVIQRTALLEAARHDLQTLFDAVPTLIGYWDTELCNRVANRAYAQWFGLEPDQIRGRRMQDLVSPADFEHARPFAEGALRGEVQSFERVVRPAGSSASRHMQAQYLPDVVGGVLRGFYVVAHDVTEQLESRQRLAASVRENQGLLSTIMHHSIVSVTDRTGRIIDVNDNFVNISGYRRDELLGRTHAVVRSGEHDGAFWAGVWRQIARGQPWRGEVCNQAKDGSTYWVDSVIAPFLGEDGAVEKYVSIRTDITARKAAEASLREATREAEQANEAKSLFLANMSHEIRSPLNAVIGLSHLLGQTALDPEQASFLGKIDAASKSLLGVINNVLDVSKIEAGELTIEHAPFSLGRLLHDLQEVMSLQAEAKSITFTVDAADDLPLALDGDAVRLGQILTNLVSNAIKFTERGAVRLAVGLLPSSAQVAKLHLMVQDTGIGIAPEMQAKVFSPFAQADASTTRRFGGSGLGLSIVKRLVTLMGGEVHLTSQLGVGTEVEVTIELRRAPDDALRLLTPSSPAIGGGLAGARILVADDSDINLEVARRILENEGAQVTLAINGRDAVDQLRASPHAIDLVLLDLQMPVVDGCQAAQQIRQELGLSRLPIIALTAGALTSKVDQARAAGMDDFITKPFDPRELVRRLRRHLCARDVIRSSLVPTVAPTWPEIEGIDGADAQLRMGGDVRFFRTQLLRMLREFADIDVPPPTATTCRALGARAHKLAGCAGMLGAKALWRRAREVEAACRAGDLAASVASVALLGAELEQLGAASASALQDVHTDDLDPISTPPAPGLDHGRVQTLLALLRTQSMDALEALQAMAPQLRSALGKDAYIQVREQVDELRFADAARSLASLTA